MLGIARQHSGPETAPERLVKLQLVRYSWTSQNTIITFTRDAHGRVAGLTALQAGQITKARKPP